jgi:hypothetical protein
VSGVCCDGSCTDACSACNVAGAVGRCVKKPATALVFHLPFDETVGSTARDASCNGNDGAVTGTPKWTPGGKRSGAIVLDGKTSVRVADSPTLRAPHTTGQVTLAAWVLQTGGAGTQVIISQQAGSAGYEHYTLRLNVGRPQALIETKVLGTPSNCLENRAIIGNQWVHLAMTFDGTTVLIYRNGNEVCRLDRAVTFAADTTPIFVGASNDVATETPSNFFQGLIDEALVYSRALSAAEVLSLANQGMPPAQ